MKAVVVLLVLALAQTAASQQAPQAQSSPATASIEGSVVRFGSTDGVARAKVTLSPSQSSVAGQAVIVDGRADRVDGLAAGEPELGGGECGRRPKPTAVDGTVRHQRETGRAGLT